MGGVAEVTCHRRLGAVQLTRRSPGRGPRRSGAALCFVYADALSRVLLAGNERVDTPPFRRAIVSCAVVGEVS